MSLLFIGAEIEDFTVSGGAGIDATTARVRSAYARTAVTMAGGTFGSAAYVKASFAASSTVNVTARFQYNSSSNTGAVFMWLATGGSARLRLKIASGGIGVSTIALESYTSGGSATTLATSVLTVTITTLYKLDWLTTYGTSGRSRLYVDGTLFFDTGTMDVTASSATTLDGLYLAGASTSTSFNTYWSEVIVADEDTRPLGVKTLAPNATGDTTAWTSGTWADIDDVTASDLDLAVSDTAAQILAVNCTGMPTGYGGLTVRAVKSVVYAARGASGPSKIDIGLRQSSTNGFAASQTLDTGYGTFSATWTTNPITSATFTGAEIDAIQLAYRSAT